MHDQDRDITPPSPHPILRSAREREGLAIDAAEGAEHAMRALGHELSNIVDSCIRCVARARAATDPSSDAEELALGAADSYLRAAEASLQEAATMVKGVLRTGSLTGAPSSRALSARRAPAEILAHAAEALMPLAEETGVALTTHIAPGARDLPPLPLYPIVANAMRNAVEATPPGGSVRARLSVVADSPQAGPALLLHIDDDGPGPPTDFDPFEPDFSTKDGNRGIGLAIARDVARDIGARISLEQSPETAGARFTLSVPISKRIIG
ncbi:MAG: sensor histidine kinase [Planctomycetota bacterium]